MRSTGSTQLMSSFVFSFKTLALITKCKDLTRCLLDCHIGFKWKSDGLRTLLCKPKTVSKLTLHTVFLVYALTEYPGIVFILNKWICVSIEKGAAVEIARSGILPTLAQALRCKSSLSCQVALVVAEMAREGRILLMLFEKTKPDKLYNISPTNDKIQPYCCLLL